MELVGIFRISASKQSVVSAKEAIDAGMAKQRVLPEAACKSAATTDGPLNRY
jgi:hypothetical protein